VHLLVYHLILYENARRNTYQDHPYLLRMTTSVFNFIRATFRPKLFTTGHTDHAHFLSLSERVQAPVQISVMTNHTEPGTRAVSTKQAPIQEREVMEIVHVSGPFQRPAPR
jgi:hypothetical protein